MLNEALFNHLAQRAMALAPWPDPRFPPSAYYRFFRVLTEAMQPSLSVELGLCGGGGSFHMAIGWSGGTVVGVEHEVGDAFQQANWAFMKQRLGDQFVLWKGDSVADAEKIFRQYGPVGVLFIDTTHTLEQTRAEWAAWEPFMAPRAVACFDDLFRPGMNQAWTEVAWQKQRYDALHSGAELGGGFGVAWRG